VRTGRAVREGSTREQLEAWREGRERDWRGRTGIVFREIGQGVYAGSEGRGESAGTGGSERENAAKGKRG
jgi:hypothetical protein